MSSEDTYTCETCNTEGLPIESLRVTVDEIAACPECYFICDWCGGADLNDNGGINHRRNRICSVCVDSNDTVILANGRYCSRDNAIFVEDTEEYVHDSDSTVYYHEAAEGYYSFPENNDSDEQSGLYDYGTNVLSILHVDTDAIGSRFVMGFELEMEATNGRQGSISSHMGAKGKDYILAADGSLEHGAEMITVPYTLDEHRKRNWETTLKQLRTVAESGTAEVTTAGMHVHVNRAALTALQIGKMLVFLNNPKNSNALTAIAQRAANSYCSRSRKKLTDGREQGDKYDMLHVASRTIEFRLFKGNLRLDRVLKNLEFCHALCVYMRTCSMKVCDSFEAFASWVMAAPKAYPYLSAFLLERNLVTPSRFQLRPAPSADIQLPTTDEE